MTKKKNKKKKTKKRDILLCFPYRVAHRESQHGSDEYDYL